ncbi:MAG: hypothetical protein NTW54_03460 [Bacteroidetes bacterium]|nr:hypothetical protein [Bacteroidota bacterium]
MTSTPILFLIFNRPDTTLQVFEKIRENKPEKFYIAADGPRSTKPGEQTICDQLRATILAGIDWKCEIKTLFRKENLGCMLAVTGAIDWFFEQEEMGIILEDDCLPNNSFFRFCNELLVHYKDDERIMQISGNNFQFGKKWGEASYYFSKYNHIWGWATWRRAWKLNTLDKSQFDDFVDSNQINYLFQNAGERKFWMDHLKSVYRNSDGSVWDAHWTLSMWMQNGLCILPNVNLVSNIGFGEDALHTKDGGHTSSKIETKEMDSIILHPAYPLRNFLADNDTYNSSYKSLPQKSLAQKIKNIITFFK